MGTSGSIVKNSNQLQPRRANTGLLIARSRSSTTAFERPISYVFRYKPDVLCILWDQIWDFWEKEGWGIDDLSKAMDPEGNGYISKEALEKVFSSFVTISIGAAHINDLCHENGNGVDLIYLDNLFYRICGNSKDQEGETGMSDPPSQRPSNYIFRGENDQLRSIWDQIWTYCEKNATSFDSIVLTHDRNKNGLISKEDLIRTLGLFGVQVVESTINDLCHEHDTNGNVDLNGLVLRIKGCLNGKGAPQIQYSNTQPEINIQPAPDSTTPGNYKFRGQPDQLKELWERILLYSERVGQPIDDMVLQFDRNKNGMISKEELIEMLAYFEQNVGLAKINDLCHEHGRNGEVDLKSLLARIKGIPYEEEDDLPAQPPLGLKKISGSSQKPGTKRTTNNKSPKSKCQVELLLPNAIEIATGTKMKIVKPNKPWRNGKLVVMKVLKCDDNDEVNDKRGEARINYRLSHIPRIIDVYEDKCLPNPAGGFNVIIVSEYAEQLSLDVLIKKRSETGKKFRENQLASFLFNAVEVLAASEQLGIAHRDIKPGNILIFADGDFKICDFGVSREVSQETLFNTLVGTPHYFSYELMNAFVDRIENHDVPITFDWFKNDVMSLAIMVIHMALLSMKVQLNASRSAETSQKKAFEDMAYLSNPFKNILKEMLAVNPAIRPNFTQLLEKCKRLSFQQEKLADPIEESKAPEVLRPTGLEPTLENATFNKPGAQSGNPLSNPAKQPALAAAVRNTKN